MGVLLYAFTNTVNENNCLNNNAHFNITKRDIKYTSLLVKNFIKRVYI